MTTSKDLLLAILAMDSYNREYGAGLVVSGTQVGEATFQAHDYQKRVSETTFKDWQSSGFYAAAYTWGNDTVISYRGTDNLSLNPFGASDIFNGWIAATGIQTGQVLR